jgi:hypothetical protein
LSAGYATNHRRAVEVLFRGSGGLPCLETHFNLTQTKDLGGFESAFGYFLAVNERAVCGTYVTNRNFTTAQQNLAVMAGNRRLGYLKRIVVSSADSGFLHIQLVATPSHSGAEEYKL